LCDQPWDETAHAAAADDFFDMTEKAFPAFDRTLRRPQIGFVENEVERLFIAFVERLAKRHHETAACRAAAEFGEIDDTGERFAGNDAAKCCAHVGGDRHVGMAAAEDDDGITGCRAVGAGAQSPPDAEGINDRYARAAVDQALDESLGRIGLARTGGADDDDAVVEGFGRNGGGGI
jgi:hypothetical protein